MNCAYNLELVVLIDTEFVDGVVLSFGVDDEYDLGDTFGCIDDRIRLNIIKSEFECAVLYSVWHTFSCWIDLSFHSAYNAGNASLWPGVVVSPFITICREFLNEYQQFCSLRFMGKFSITDVFGCVRIMRTHYRSPAIIRRYASFQSQQSNHKSLSNTQAHTLQIQAHSSNQFESL